MPISPLLTPDTDSIVDTPADFAVTPGEADIDDTQPAPDFTTTLGAAFRRGNIIASRANDLTADSPTDDEDLNVWDEIKGTWYEPHYKSFEDIPRNKTAVDNMKRQILKEDEDRKIEDASPWYKLVPSQVLAGVADPTIALPGGAIYRVAKAAAPAAGIWAGVKVTAKSGASLGTAAAAGVGVQEAFLHDSQATRTIDESLTNVAFGGALGTGLGLGVGGSIWLKSFLGDRGAATLSPAQWRRSSSDMEAYITGQPRPANPSEWAKAEDLLLDMKDSLELGDYARYERWKAFGDDRVAAGACIGHAGVRVFG